MEAFIGNTPLFPIIGLHKNEKVKIFAKLEWQQWGNSVKARPAFNIIKQAILNGDLSEGKHLLDASSGNTGVAYAGVAAALGIPFTLCIPENASSTKIAALKAFGANLIFTSKYDLTDGAQEKAVELQEAEPDKYFYADQYANDNNWKAHYKSTGPEIYNQTKQAVTHFIAGLGTTGTFTGTARALKDFDKNIKVIALHPDSALHGLEGWKDLETAKVPKFYDPELADENRVVSTETAYKYVKIAGEKLGLMLSPSSAANLSGALQLADELEEGTVVTVFPDHGSNYPEVMKEIF
ncbi:MAG: cysteine synthase family protein [Chitinophagales bacterium]